MVGWKRMIFALALLVPARLPAQTKCPPLPEGVACDHYHYHVSVWNIDNRSYDNVAATRQFASMPACDKARGDALRENAALVEFVKLKIDTSMLPNRFSECHCDRTQEASSGAFLDAKARVIQLRAQQDAAWTMRERLLSRDVPGSGDHLNSLFGAAPRLDRFFREMMPPRLPTSAASRRPVTLLESKIGSQTAMPAIAANVTLAAMSVPPAPPAAPAQPAAAKPPGAQPPAPPTAAPPPVPADAHPPASATEKKP